MKILYVSPYPPARDGIGTYTSVLAGAMRDRAHQAVVVVPRLAPDSPGDVVGAISWRPARGTALRRAIAALGPDVVHVQFSVAAFGSRTPALMRWLGVLRRDLGVPVIVTMHEVTRDTALLRGVGRSLYRRLARQCDRVIVHTQAARSALTGPIGVPPGQVTVIPHPSARPPAQQVATTELRRRFGLGDAPILLAFGFIHVDKGLQDLVRAIGLLRRTGAPQCAELRVVVAGAVRRRSGPMRAFEALDRVHLRWALWLARRHRIRDQIVLTGYVPDTEVAGWFGAADAAVLPYRRIEQSGVAGLALAFGTPVLASQVGGLGELFADSRWTFPARSPERLADTIARFLATPTETRGRRAGAAHGWLPAQNPGQAADLSAVAAATLDLYAVATSGSAGGLARVG